MTKPEEYRMYLAKEIISNRRTLSYRTVSRALKIHVDAAKRMLFDFYEHENKKKPGSIYATYILTGVKKEDVVTAPAQHGTVGPADSFDADLGPMPSSPPPFSSSMLNSSQASEKTVRLAANTLIHVRSITLVREDRLDAVKDKYDSISSIHIYSLSPHRLQDLNVLDDTTRDVWDTYHVKEDPLTYYKTYGIIQNPHVRRRTGRKPPLADPVPAPKFKAVAEAPKRAVENIKKEKGDDSKAPPSKLKQELTREDSKESRPSSASSTTTPKPSQQQPVTLKREGSLFKSFAKAANKPKPKTTRTDSQTSNGTSATEELTRSDDDEGQPSSEDEALYLDNNTSKSSKGKKRSSDASDAIKSQRAEEDAEKRAKLAKMMEDDSSDSDSGADGKVKASQHSKQVAKPASESVDPPVVSVKPDGTETVDDQGPEGEGELAWSDSENENSANKRNVVKEETVIPQQEPQPTRRRGKRKVMRKKTMKDEEGYLVTKEEAVWESFSEDESVPAAKKAMPLPKVQVKPSSQKAGGKGTQKGGGGGGGIASFFKKK